MILFVDVGADEVNCEDVYNERDWNADGVVNLEEFVHWSRSWLGRWGRDLDITTDPNNIGQPNYADPNTIAQWRLTWSPKCNLDTSGGSEYAIDIADLQEFIGQYPDTNRWLWTACWRQQEMFEQQMAMGGGGESMMMGAAAQTEIVIPAEAGIQPDSAATLPAETTTPAIAEPVDIDPVVEMENLLSLLEDINILIDAGGDDAQAWQDIKILLEQTLVDMGDTTNDPNSI